MFPLFFYQSSLRKFLFLGWLGRCLMSILNCQCIVMVSCLLTFWSEYVVRTPASSKRGCWSNKRPAINFQVSLVCYFKELPIDSTLHSPLSMMLTSNHIFREIREEQLEISLQVQNNRLGSNIQMRIERLKRLSINKLLLLNWNWYSVVYCSSKPRQLSIYLF